jgi:protein tyrosine phosphatase (PTP) superfamily phosphohydrolase (DUF442 family)
MTIPSVASCCRGLIVAALVAGGCCSPSQAPPSPTTPPTPAAYAANVPGIVNFGYVTPTLWRGAKPDRNGMASLAAMHVGTIIDLQEDDESADVPIGVKYVHLPVSGWHADQVDVPAVLAAIKAGPAPVFVHCREGRDRTGLAIAAYRLSTGWTAEAACAELPQFHINFWWEGPVESRVRRLAVDRAALKSG